MTRALAFVASLLFASFAHAQYVVGNLNDAGPGSLRQAILDANGDPGANTITFAFPGLITLTTGQLVVTETLTITGAGARLMTIDGNLNGRIFEVQGSSTNLTLSGMTLTRGLVNGNGGAILNNGGNLTLSFMRITQNQASGDGGAIYDPFQPDVGGNSVNFLTISNSEISINRANKAAGIFHSGFELRIDNSTIYNNIATDSVGGIHEQGGFATIRNSTISDNNASTVGGILVETFGDFYVFNFESTIVANNTDLSGLNDINRTGSGVVNATSSLFEEDVNATSVINGTNTGNQVGVDPQLVALGDNGGPTNSMRPGPTSPAIGTGSNSQGYAFDQRGSGFPRDAGGAVDVGAIQRGVQVPPPPFVPVPGPGGALLVLLAAVLAAFGARRLRR